MRVLFCAGEASGDLYAASLARELLAINPSVSIGGIGGLRFEEAATESLIADSSKWGAISITQSFREGFKVLRHYQNFKNELKKGPPGVFVPIDFGFVNLKLCRFAKEAGWKVVYFVPPGSWRRDRQGADLPRLTDQIVTPFPWSYEILKANGANVHFFGHPLKQIQRSVIRSDAPRSGLAVLPGSRRSELEQLLPLFAEVLTDEPCPAKLPVPRTFTQYVREHWPRSGDEVIDGSQTGAVIRTLRDAEHAVVCSGTATLEAALASTPMVVCYRVSQLVLLEAKLIGFKRPQFYSQPNILLQRQVVPELIQETLSVETLRSKLAEIRTEKEMAHQRLGFEEISELLGADDCITRTAQLILE